MHAAWYASPHIEMRSTLFPLRPPTLPLIASGDIIVIGLRNFTNPLSFLWQDPTFPLFCCRPFLAKYSFTIDTEVCFFVYLFVFLVEFWSPASCGGVWVRYWAVCAGSPFSPLQPRNLSALCFSFLFPVPCFISARATILSYPAGWTERFRTGQVGRPILTPLTAPPCAYSSGLWR